mgnify:FL=1
MRVCLAVAAAVVVALLVWPSAIAQAPAPILRCYHNGEVVAAAPLPAPPDFRVQMSAGSVTSAEWTLEGGRRVVLATTAPCLYLVTTPPEGARGAGQ